MKAVELAYSIYQTATAKGKKAWLSEKQEQYLFSLLSQEGNWNEQVKIKLIGSLLPDGSIRGLNELTLGEAIQIGEQNIKRIKIIYPPHYIKQNGFNRPQIIIV